MAAAEFYLVGTVVRVQAIRHWTGSDIAELILTFADGREVTVAPIGYNEGLDVYCRPEADVMSFGSKMQKFAEIAGRVAPMAMIAAGLPVAAASAVAQAIVLAQGLRGQVSNADKAAHALAIAKASIEAMNAIAMDAGGTALIDQELSDEAIAVGLKLTYDVAKLVHTAQGDAMPTPLPVSVADATGDSDVEG